MDPLVEDLQATINDDVADHAKKLVNDGGAEKEDQSSWMLYGTTMRSQIVIS